MGTRRAKRGFSRSTFGRCTSLRRVELVAGPAVSLHSHRLQALHFIGASTYVEPGAESRDPAAPSGAPFRWGHCGGIDGHTSAGQRRQSTHFIEAPMGRQSMAMVGDSAHRAFGRCTSLRRVDRFRQQLVQGPQRLRAPRFIEATTSAPHRLSSAPPQRRTSLRRVRPAGPPRNAEPLRLPAPHVVEARSTTGSLTKDVWVPAAPSSGTLH